MSTMSQAKVAKSKAAAKSMTQQEIQQSYNRLQNELQAVASKIGELESEAEEHELVLSTLKETLQSDPCRKCFRLIGGVLVERTVKDVVPTLQTNRDGIKKVIASLIDQYKAREEEFDTFKRDYDIRPVVRN